MSILADFQNPFLKFLISPAYEFIEKLMQLAIEKITVKFHK